MLQEVQMIMAFLILSFALVAFNAKADPLQLRRIEYKSEVAYPQLDGFYNIGLQRKINEHIKIQIDQFWPANVEPRRVIGRKFDYETPLANEKILSVKMHYQISESGKIGSIFGLKTINIDLKSGEEIPLLAFFQHRKTSFAKLDKLIRRHLKEQTKMLYEEQAIKPISGTHPYYLTPDSLVLYFNPEEVAPKIEGIVEVKISFATIKPFLNDFARRILQ